jgi:hypothetical protein
LNLDDSFARPSYENNFLLENLDDDSSILRLSGQFEQNLFFDDKEATNLMAEEKGANLTFDLSNLHPMPVRPQQQPQHLQPPLKLPPNTIPSFPKRDFLSHPQHATAHSLNQTQSKPVQAMGHSPTSYQPTSPFLVSHSPTSAFPVSHSMYPTTHAPESFNNPSPRSYPVKSSFSPNSNSPRSNSLYSLYSPSSNNASTNALNNINTISLNHNASVSNITTPCPPIFHLTDSVGMNVESNRSHYPSSNTNNASNTNALLRHHNLSDSGMNVDSNPDLPNEQPMPNLTTPVEIIQAVKKTNEFSQLKITNAFNQQRV